MRVLGRVVFSLYECQTPTQHWIKILHPWVQEFYPVLGLGFGGRRLRHFQTPTLHWIHFSLRVVAHNFCSNVLETGIGGVKYPKIRGRVNILWMWPFSTEILQKILNLGGVKSPSFPRTTFEAPSSVRYVLTPLSRSPSFERLKCSRKKGFCKELRMNFATLWIMYWIFAEVLFLARRQCKANLCVMVHQHCWTSSAFKQTQARAKQASFLARSGPRVHTISYAFTR